MPHFLNNNHATPEMKKLKREIKRDIKRYFVKNLNITETFVQPDDKFDLYVSDNATREPYVTIFLAGFASEIVTPEAIQGLKSYLENDCTPRPVTYLVGSCPAAAEARVDEEGNEIVPRDFSYHLYIVFDDYENHTYEEAVEENNDDNNIVNYEVGNDADFD